MLTSRSTYKNTPSPPEVKVSLVIFVRAFKCSSWSSPSKCVCWPWVDSLDVKNQSPGSKNQVVKKWLSIWNINKYKNKYILIIVIWKKEYKHCGFNWNVHIYMHIQPLIPSSFSSCCSSCSLYMILSYLESCYHAQSTFMFIFAFFSPAGKRLTL